MFIHHYGLLLLCMISFEVKIIDGEEHWRIRYFKESAHMLGNSDLLSRPSIEMNTIWGPIIKKVTFKKKIIT